MIKTILVFAALSLPAGAHDLDDNCLDASYRKAVNYCQSLYGRRSRGFASCRLGAAHTYEALLLNETTTNREICQPYFLRSCDSGRKLMMAKSEELCAE